MGIIIKKDIIEKNTFKQVLDGGTKNAFSSFGNLIILNQDREENLNIFFLSRLYRFLGAKTFKTYIGLDSKSNIFVMMNDLYKNTKNVQFAFEKPDSSLGYAFYLNENLMMEFIRRDILMVILNNFINISNINMFFDEKDIFLIDLNFEKDLYVANYPIFMSMNENGFNVINISNIFNNVSLQIIKETIESRLIFSRESLFFDERFLEKKLNISTKHLRRLSVKEAIQFINKNYILENSGEMESRIDRIIKFSMVDILEKYDDKNDSVNNFLRYLKNDYDNYVLTNVLVAAREYLIHSIRKIMLLDKNDIAYITLDYNPKLLKISEEEIQNFKDFIYNKQLELFYYASKYRFLHKLLNRQESEEKQLQRDFEVDNLRYFDVYKLKNIEAIRDLNISNINFKEVIEQYENCLKDFDSIFCLKYMKDNLNFMEYNLELASFKESLRPKLLKFQEVLRKEFNKKVIPSWTEETYKSVLYGDYSDIYMDQLIDIKGLAIIENNKNIMYIKKSNNINNIEFYSGLALFTLVVFIIIFKYRSKIKL